jgi:hypothetical protein
MRPRGSQTTSLAAAPGARNPAAGREADPLLKALFALLREVWQSPEEVPDKRATALAG